MTVRDVYDGSDGEATKALYAQLEVLGPCGIVALNVFRAQKNSERAKGYRGRGYKDAAYGRKQWAMGNLYTVLQAHAADLGIMWGWAEDGQQEYHKWVLYLELPLVGQVSFHTASRGIGPDFRGVWDGEREVCADRIVRWCQDLLDGNHGRTIPETLPRMPRGNGILYVIGDRLLAYTENPTNPRHGPSLSPQGPYLVN